MSPRAAIDEGLRVLDAAGIGANGNGTAALHYELTDFHSSRPGHDLRYALDGEKMRKLGWEPPDTIEQTLEKTVDWSLHNPEWLGAS